VLKVTNAYAVHKNSMKMRISWLIAFLFFNSFIFGQESDKDSLNEFMGKTIKEKIGYLEKYSISLNPNAVPYYYKDLEFYEAFDNKYIQIRELGAWIMKWQRPEQDPEPYCPNITTVVYEDFFAEGDKISYLLKELERISIKRFRFKTIEETIFTESTDFTKNPKYRIVIEYEDKQLVFEKYLDTNGWLDEELLFNEIFSSLNKVKALDNFVYYTDMSTTFIYFDDQEKMESFLYDFDKYKLLKDV
jgi:hypothetical protein